MDIKDLEAVLALDEERHFGRAAARLHMTQPPFSQRLARLEAELGVTLFRRSCREVAPTPAGQVFLAEIRPLQASLERAAARARQAAAGETGLVRLGFVGAAMESELPVLLRRCRDALPGIELLLEELPSVVQLERLQAGTLDAGFVRLFEALPATLERKELLRDEYLLAVPAGHPLAVRRRLALAELRGEPWIMYPRRAQPALFDAVRTALEQAGAPPRIVQEAMSKRSTLALVAAGFGMALMPAWLAAQGRDGVVFVPLEPGLPPVTIHLVWRSNLESPALARVLAFFESQG